MTLTLGINLQILTQIPPLFPLISYFLFQDLAQEPGLHAAAVPLLTSFHL